MVKKGKELVVEDNKTTLEESKTSEIFVASKTRIPNHTLIVLTEFATKPDVERIVLKAQGGAIQNAVGIALRVCRKSKFQYIIEKTELIDEEKPDPEGFTRNISAVEITLARA